MGKICTFFGHRQMHVDSVSLEKAIRTAIEQHGTDTFWCGGYGDFDRHAAASVQQLKGNYPHIRLIHVYAYLPKKMERLSEYYDGSIYPEGLEAVPQRFAISKRNQWMVDHCDILICAVFLQTGGAYQAFRRAVSRNKTILSIGKSSC